MTKKIVLLASGSGSLAQAVLEAELDLEISLLISDRPAPVLEIAENHGVRSELVNFNEFESRQAWGRELSALVESVNPDLVVSVGFMRILPRSFVERFKIINTHPALLPLFPGAHAVRDALEAGATESGTTVHWVDAGVDTGNVIKQVRVPVNPGDTEESLHERIKIQERTLIVETLQIFQAGELVGEL
jgi:phosphoribosylglycinamide formyltransferase-1